MEAGIQARQKTSSQIRAQGAGSQGGRNACAGCKARQVRRQGKDQARGKVKVQVQIRRPSCFSGRATCVQPLQNSFNRAPGFFRPRKTLPFALDRAHPHRRALQGCKSKNYPCRRAGVPSNLRLVRFVGLKNWRCRTSGAEVGKRAEPWNLSFAEASKASRDENTQDRKASLASPVASVNCSPHKETCHQGDHRPQRQYFKEQHAHCHPPCSLSIP